ncbi:hypothetical protein G6F37_000042 [Rhizopus arrhizus]|nr:hypothetical protein G6F38_000052 [Rhizopus arrhizus]KAG1164701.1 hypothetical protein G6F37_000042 [Rhizopus arrhizus]
MGNQTSRLDQRGSNGRINTDPCLNNMRQLHDDQDPFKRQYPLPSIANEHDRIKPRKQSSPAVIDPSRRKQYKKIFFRSNTTSSNNFLKENNASVDISSFSSQRNIHPLATTPSFHSMDQYTEAFSTSADTLRYTTQGWDDAYYSTIQNRKYHKVNGSNYILPCDDEEIDRLHLQHFMIRFAIQGNYLAPVHDMLRKGSKILDVGCGPGTWSMEIAGEYPKSTVIGIDMTPLFPREIKPSNCAFYQCNLLNKLPFEDSSFDYVFMRFMNQGISADQWLNLLKELSRILKPNGWIEWVEADNEIHRPGPITKEFNQQLIQLMEHHQQDPSLGKHLQEKLKETNQFNHISSMFVSCPGGQWAGKLGKLTMQAWKAYYQALRPLLCELWGVTEKEYTEKLKQCWREADEHKTFENIHFCYAQKKA